MDQTCENYSTRFWHCYSSKCINLLLLYSPIPEGILFCSRRKDSLAWHCADVSLSWCLGPSESGIFFLIFFFIDYRYVTDGTDVSVGVAEKRKAQVCCFSSFCLAFMHHRYICSSSTDSCKLSSSDELCAGSLLRKHGQLCMPRVVTSPTPAPASRAARHVPISVSWRFEWRQPRVRRWWWRYNIWSSISLSLSLPPSLLSYLVRPIYVVPSARYEGTESSFVLKHVFEIHKNSVAECIQVSTLPD